MGRSRSCECGHCAKCKQREKARAKYQALSVDERRALVARRDAEKVRAADRARYERDKPKRLLAMAEYAVANRDRVYGHKRAWARRNPEKRQAQVAVSNALRDGRLVKGLCEVCGATEKVYARIEDYSNPLNVRWLCPPHHAADRKAKRSSPDDQHIRFDAA